MQAEQVSKAVLVAIDEDAGPLPSGVREPLIYAAKSLASFVLENCKDEVLDTGLALSKAMALFAYALVPLPKEP